MKIIVIKVNPDVVNGGIHSAEVGLFEAENAQPTIRMRVTKENMIRDKEIKVGQELKLTPIQ